MIVEESTKQPCSIPNGLSTEEGEEKFVAGYMELTGATINEARNAYMLLKSKPCDSVDMLKSEEFRHSDS